MVEKRWSVDLVGGEERLEGEAMIDHPSILEAVLVARALQQHELRRRYLLSASETFRRIRVGSGGFLCRSAPS